MSRKRDPVLAVLNYFETAEPALAAQALTLAQQILRRRSPKGPPAKARPSRAKPPATAPAAAGSPTPPPGVAPALN